MQIESIPPNLRALLAKPLPRICKGFSKSRLSVASLRRKISSAGIQLAFGRNKCRERQTRGKIQQSLSALQLGAEPRVLVEVYFHCDKVDVDVGSGLGIGVTLAIHQAAPGTPDGAYIQKHRHVTP